MTILLFTSEGWMDLDEQYVPGCVAAELGEGRAEASKALAVAARTYVLRAIKDDPTLGTEAKPIPNHARFQVFQRTAPATVQEAAVSTKGIVCRYGGALTLSNHVLGAPWTESGQREQDMTDTEQWVTYNDGKTGAAVKPSPISNTSRKDNRGCMSTRGAEWLARHDHRYPAILRYFYGADLAIGPLDAGPPILGGPAQQPPAQQPPTQWPPTSPTVPIAAPVVPAAAPTPSGASPLPALALAAALFIGEAAR